MALADLDRLDVLLPALIAEARIPGTAIAVVTRDGIVFARGVGLRDTATGSPMTIDSAYPIASTTKAINATLLAMLVGEGLLAWDAPIRDYLPRFALADTMASERTTLRDLVAMRTGLPRHDLVWLENPVGYGALVDIIAHLPLSAGFRERFQYNNLTVTLAAHITEVVTAERWEALVDARILKPLGMTRTQFGSPDNLDATTAYHENGRREIVPYRRFDTSVIGPAGGTVHSTISDMARWVSFNLAHGCAGGRQLLPPSALTELFKPAIVMGDDPVAPSPLASYGLGWAIDTYHGHLRFTHGGDLHDVNSCVSLFPESGIGVVSFVNLASLRLARAINQLAFNLTAGLPTDDLLDKPRAEYEAKISALGARRSQLPRVVDTSPSHGLADYAGCFRHPAYGAIEIVAEGRELSLRRGTISVPLEHWHFDSWMPRATDLFHIFRPGPFDDANPIRFETGMSGRIEALWLEAEPAIGPERFVASESQ